MQPDAFVIRQKPNGEWQRLKPTDPNELQAWYELIMNELGDPLWMPDDYDGTTNPPT